MRERLITLLCALAALLIFTALFVHGGGGGAQRAALPTTIERRGNGLAAAFAWLKEERVLSVSLRERFDTLATRHDLNGSGNLLIMTLPLITPLRVSEVRSLDGWVRAGNTLLILAALSDRPDWAAEAAVPQNDLRQLTGLDFQTERVRDRAQAAVVDAFAAARELNPPRRGLLVPNGAHPYLAQVREALALSDYPPQPWVLQLPREGFVLALARQRETGKAVLWARPSGQGMMIVSGFGSLFSNRSLGQADNARLLANLVSATVAAGGTVLFDDMHQGLTSAYDPAKFYADPRLYRTIAVLALVWLIWVLGGTRLRSPARRLTAPREEDLVRVTGMFLARVLRPAAAARCLFEHFFKRLSARTRRAASGGDPLPWAWLEGHPRLARADVQQLKDWYARACAGERVPLVRLQNLLLRTERLLNA